MPARSNLAREKVTTKKRNKGEDENLRRPKRKLSSHYSAKSIEENPNQALVVATKLNSGGALVLKPEHMQNIEQIDDSKDEPEPEPEQDDTQSVEGGNIIKQMK